MKSENYRQLLNNEFEAKEMTKEDFDNTLIHFAMLYHKEQLKLYDVVWRSEQLISFLRQYQKSCEIMHVNKIDAKDFVEQIKNLKEI